ncbi:hypothetical protein BDP27DRAFT_1312126 [Rhodocollybia butyracea]|uniref:Magnesium transporter n=1 Tax=Rhodocollybia butyracea TaxID=206335 RepID=A0A9P5UGB4_9AGAR|nr:hypothetical protein BDP27DRAFT_1312126 [Rhodocollybia butyracea]
MATSTNPQLDRLRGAVRKVIALHRTTTVLTAYGAGAEPGVNPRHLSADLRYRGLRESCSIRVMDYSPVSITSRTMSNNEFTDMLHDPRKGARPSWAKVRWIDVGGISWDVLKALATKYNIHYLALENILHTHSKATASKSDYYLQHLFLRILCLELRDENSVIQPSEMKWEASLAVEDLEPDRGGRRGNSFYQESDAAAEQVEALKQADRVDVNVFPVFMLLFRDGTLITLHRTTNPKLTEPIRNRLARADTLLRTTSDASFLLQSLLDLAVDKAFGLAEACEMKMKKFEKQILIHPKLHTVSSLNILAGDINLHQRALEPLKRVIYGLRRYDLDRCIALLDLPPGEEQSANVQGYISHTASIYLSDVQDHVEYILGSLDIVYSLSENLIGYSFNLTSYEMNVVMKRLTLITVICLPLTFLTGYGGMNFNGMWWTGNLNGNSNPDGVSAIESDVRFWIVALPVMAIVMPLLYIPSIMKLYHHIKNRKVSRKALKSYQIQRGVTPKPVGLTRNFGR